jgi:hypothetical protein
MEGYGWEEGFNEMERHEATIRPHSSSYFFAASQAVRLRLAWRPRQYNRAEILGEDSGPGSSNLRADMAASKSDNSDRASRRNPRNL